MAETQYSRHTIPADIIDDIAVRFIVNLIPEERKFNRLCFKMEEAYWFYTDFYVAKQPERKLQAGTMRTFTEHIFRHVDFLMPHVDELDDILEEWRKYKLAVPTFGAIILNNKLDKVLLVQGYWAKNSWGFPKGKINENEEPHICAAREVYEETGYNIADQLHPDIFLEQTVNDQRIRLYIVPGVQEDTKFNTLTRYEIKAIRWFDVNLLPLTKTDLNCKIKNGFNSNSFFMVIPFMRDLVKWIKNKNFERLDRVSDKNVDNSSRNGRKASKGDRKTPGANDRKTPGGASSRETPVSQTRQTDRRKSASAKRIEEEGFYTIERLEDRRSEPKSEPNSSKGKGIRRQLFEANQQQQQVLLPQPQPLLQPQPQKQLQPQQQQQRQQQLQKAQSRKQSASEKTPKAQNPAKSRSKVAQQNNQKIDQLIKPLASLGGQPSILQAGNPAGQPNLLPPSFCPVAWKNFRLDGESLLLTALYNKQPVIKVQRNQTRGGQRVH